MYILGLSTMTESAAVLMRDSKVIAAAEEERFSRIKHDGGFPYGAVQWALESQGLTLSDIDHVAVYWNPYNITGRGRYILGTLFRSPGLFMEKTRRATKVWVGNTPKDSGWVSMFRTKHKLEQRFGNTVQDVRFFDHHTCHMASCFFASDYPESAI